MRISMYDFKDYCLEKIQIVDDFLANCLNTGSISKVDEAMSYSLMAGGKRLRPLLLMAAADTVGSNGARFVNVASALEMIHTYSLIHDDLPAMDNDDYRRGKLTNHKVFGEDIAILAGDALLTLAFECTASQKDVQPQVLIGIICDIARYAGREGMVGGQTIDTMAENTNSMLSYEQLRVMHGAKTGALFKAAICSGAKLAGASQQELAVLDEFAAAYGLVFQITDDILDVEGSFEELGKPIGSDARNDKVTYVSKFGLAGARQLANSTAQEAMAKLEIFGARAQLLKNFMEQLLSRKS